MILAQTVLVIYNSEAIGCGILGRFSNIGNFRPEAHSDVISSVVVDPTGVKVPIKFCGSKSNRSRDIRLPHFVRNDKDDAR